MLHLTPAFLQPHLNPHPFVQEQIIMLIMESGAGETKFSRDVKRFLFFAISKVQVEIVSPTISEPDGTLCKNEILQHLRLEGMKQDPLLFS
ncbi:hypothetical protein AVEN_131294-1 [Araneus ventricosus]|uniref:Uncharacterized protein n=1 Tax=Araneus ventricosus TaxID=182803 RepID=A0A4Y2HF68_ARAVE|nr:hypothetical protein AVEN_131294-1 [Araneus ventricosus]